MAEKDWFMMFPEHYTWSAAVVSAIGSSRWGGGEVGEVFKVCAALKGRVGEGQTWFSEWNRMGEKWLPWPKKPRKRILADCLCCLYAGRALHPDRRKAAPAPHG